METKTETLSGLIAEWLAAKPQSPIGPLHSAGIHDGIRWCAADLERWLEGARALVAEMPHMAWPDGRKRKGWCPVGCERCKWEALLGVPPAERKEKK